MSVRTMPATPPSVFSTTLQLLKGLMFFSFFGADISLFIYVVLILGNCLLLLKVRFD
jgi:hypothetical protein